MAAPPTTAQAHHAAADVYGAALAAVLLAALARWSLGSILGDTLPFTTFFVAIVFAAWRGGLYPALLATVLGFVFTVMLFPSAQYLGAGLSRRRVVGWLLYFAVCGVIAGFGEAMWRARRQLQSREHAAREQAQLLQITFASIGDAVITTDAGGAVTYLNPVAEQLTGYAVAEARGRRLVEVFRIVNEQTRALVDNPVEKVLALGQVVGLANHTVLIAKDGVERPIDDSGAPIRDDAGRIIGVVLVFRDVSERKRSEDQLRTQADMFRAISASTAELIYVKDREHRLLFANAATLEAMGLPATATIGAAQESLLDYPSEDEAVRAADHRIMSTGTGETGETQFTGAQGPRTYMTSKTPMRDAGGRVVGLVSITRDITARALAAQAASQRSEQVRRLAEVLPRVSAATDVSSIMRVVSAEARHLIGAHQAKATYLGGEDWANAIVVTSLSDKYAAWRDFDRTPSGDGISALVCRTNTPMRLSQAELEAHPEFRAFGPHRAGHPPLNGWLAAPLVGRNGRNLGVLQLSDKVDGAFTADDEAVLMQVAQMATVALDNARLVDDLRAADRRKDEFLSVLAHELRNPLAPIRSGLHLMKVAHDDAPAIARAREIMDRQVRQLVRIIDDLMDVTRISRGKLQVQKSRVALAHVLGIAVETSRPLIEQAGHTLTVDVPETQLIVEADETRLAQVFANLLNNAAKYTPPAGQVTLRVRASGDEAVVVVEDNGVGIPSAMLGQVFDMFMQVDRSLEKSQGGLGIGLNIARRLVHKHGGRIVAESAGEGRGSRFVVRLPLAEPSSEATAPTEPRDPARAGPPRRVLIVDDNVDITASLSLMLGAMGHEVRTAHDGRDAVTVAEQFRPDLVLMDIGMPTMNGYDACRQIREQAWAHDVVLVACTGWGQEEDRQRSKQAGFDLHLVKPPSPEALERLVAGLHGQPREASGEL